MKKKSSVFMLVLGLTLTVCAFAPSAFAASASDISGHWAEGQVLAGINYGYIGGYPDGTFKPDNTITRAEFVAIINRARNFTAMTNIPFRDVPVNEWYFQDVQKAYMAGYITGDSEGNFNPGAQITRQEVAVILNRIAPGGDTTYALYGVNDATKIDEWALPSVRAVYQRGYITGDAEGNFNPQNSLRRGEAVTIVNRLLGISPLQPGADLVALSISNINVTEIKTDGATLNITATRDGSVYWVVLEGDSATTPTAEQVLAGRGADNRNAYGTGSRTVYANTAVTASIASLQSEQSYKICAVARDAAANVSAVAIRTFTALNAGDTGEEWLNNNFTVSNIADNSFRLTANSSRTGTLYYVVVEDPNRNVKTPSQSNIRNGRDASGTSSNSSTIYSGSFPVSANTSVYRDITGLKGGTNYKVFGCVYEGSSSGSLYSRVKGATFTTTGSNANWITTFDVSQVGTGNATLNVRTDRAGTFYYVVTTDSRTPTAENIRSGREYNNSSTNVAYYSNISVSANTNSYPTMSNLTAGKLYYVYGVLYTSSNVYSEIKSYNFTAGSGTTALTNVYGTVYAGSVTTQAAINISTPSGSVYPVAVTVKNADISISNAYILITVAKGSTNSNVTSSTSGVTKQSDTTFIVPNSLTYFTLTVQESGRSDYLTYNFTIYRQ
ncbi:MAG: S-layer homology domain-containing protein [Clostridiales Family XIII bacterium]|jgi:hypothetical protein|nr:S-layer homology domain-containing protein [Clostridiales Family XIII bacterium]